MAHSASRSVHFPVPWVTPGRWLAWLARAAGALVRVCAWCVGAGAAEPDLYVSREWLADHDRWTRSHRGAV